MSGGKFEVKFFEPGALIPPLECSSSLQRIDRGLLDNTRLSYRQVPVAGLLHHGPVRTGFGEFLAWKWFGGGNKLRDEIYAKHDLMASTPSALARKPPLVSQRGQIARRAEGSEDALLRARRPGHAEARRLDTTLGGADIYQALERGVIDATEFSMPKMDINLGFHQIAKFNYFPGWHQQVSCGEFLMNKNACDALPDQYKAMIEVAGPARQSPTPRPRRSSSR